MANTASMDGKALLNIKELCEYLGIGQTKASWMRGLIKNPCKLGDQSTYLKIDRLICQLKNHGSGSILKKYIYAYLFGLLNKSERIDGYG